MNITTLQEYLTNFNLGSSKTIVESNNIAGQIVPYYVNEYWTSRQRQSCSIHEISYRACFKAELPKFFIELLTNVNDTIYDPFSGRGTTGIEAGLLQRNFIINDVNPLSRILSEPRFFIPTLSEVEDRLNHIEPVDEETDVDMSMFYHHQTFMEILGIKKHLSEKQKNGNEDNIDKWIRMIATNRLTGHSKGFFSVYTLPPNQAVSPDRQILINKKLNQTPEYRNTKLIILKKTKSLIKNITDQDKINLYKAGKSSLFLCTDSRNTNEIPDNKVNLTVTSPPFLNVVRYSADNWLRCWFNDIDVQQVSSGVTESATISDWSSFIKDVFSQLYRITAPKGWVAFEVGEVNSGKTKLEETVAPAGIECGFKCAGVLVNSQQFTKTAQIWGISNNSKGTNTNRIILFQK